MQDGTRQYVILGAGLDTFAFRGTDFAGGLSVFEVDHPLTQADKRERIARAGWMVPQNLTFVPVDFTKDDPAEKLLSCGLNPEVKTFFSWLGVTYYLAAETVDETLGKISELCPEGSMLVFDYPDENFFAASEKRVQNTILMAKAGGEAMKSSFSCPELKELLERHGFFIRELLMPKDIQREVIDKVGASIKAFEHVNYCLAVKGKTACAEENGLSRSIRDNAAPITRKDCCGEGEKT